MRAPSRNAKATQLISTTPSGNMTTMPQPANLNRTYTLTFDAWDRLVRSTTIMKSECQENEYDGLGRRIVRVERHSQRHYDYNCND